MTDFRGEKNILAKLNALPVRVKVRVESNGRGDEENRRMPGTGGK